MSVVPLEQVRGAETAAARENPSDAPLTGVTGCSSAHPRRFQLVLVGREGPCKQTRYALYADGRLIASDKRTTAEGLVDEPIGTASAVELHVWFDAFAHPEIYHFKVTKLPPVDTPEGLAIRLRNLGGGVPESGEVTERHVRRFQRRWGLAETGAIDAALRADLVRLHGS